MTFANRYTELTWLASSAAGVEAIWTSLSDKPAKYRVLPDGRCDIILEFDVERLHVQSPTVLITGPTACFYDIPVKAGIGYAGIRLRPGYIQPMLGIEPASIRDRVLTGAEAICACPSLAALCKPASGPDELVTRLLDFVRHRAERNELEPSRLVRDLLDTFHTSGGRLSVQEVAQMHGIDVRTVARVVVSATGLSPKTFASILRFHQALRLLRDKQLSPAEAAIESGFSDQSHMNRACQRFGGLTPARLPDVTIVTIAG